MLLFRSANVLGRPRYYQVLIVTQVCSESLPEQVLPEETTPKLKASVGQWVKLITGISAWMVTVSLFPLPRRSTKRDKPTGATSAATGQQSIAFSFASTLVPLPLLSSDVRIRGALQSEGGIQPPALHGFQPGAEAGASDPMRFRKPSRKRQPKGKIMWGIMT